MAEFYIKTSSVRRQIEKIEACGAVLAEQKKRLDSIHDTLDSHYEGINNTLQALVNRLDRESRYMDELAVALEKCIKRFELAENNIISVAVVNEVLGEVAEDTAEDNDSVLDYLLEAGRQVLFGTWTDDVNLLGTTCSVVLGFIPGVGLALDVRDFVGDIKNLCTDGATAGEWINLGLDGLAVVLDFVNLGELVTPFKMGLKNADAIAEIGKSISKHVDEYTDFVKGVFRDFDWKRVGKEIWDGGKKYIDEVFHIKDTVKELDKFADMIKNAGRTINTTIQDAYNNVKEEFGDFLTDIGLMFG